MNRKSITFTTPRLKLYTLIIDSDGLLSSKSFLSTRNIELDDAVKQFIPDFDINTDRVEMDVVYYNDLKEI